MSGVDNLDYMYSINTNNGMMTLYNYFALGTDANTTRSSPRCAKGRRIASCPGTLSTTG